MKSKLMYIYYGILLLLLFVTGGEAAPSMLLRLLFLALVFIPVLTKYRELFPICVICFYTIGVNLDKYSLMPYEIYIYIILTVLALVFVTKTKKTRFPIRVRYAFFFFAFYVFCVNIFNGNFDSLNLFYTLIILGLFCLFTIVDERAEFNFLNCFCIISLLLSVKYFLKYNDYLSLYVGGDGLERSGWTDPNYFSCLIGMGFVSAMYQLLNFSKALPFKKIFWIVVMILSFAAQLLLASRGGIIVTLIPSIIILFSSKLNLSFKLLFLFISFVVILFLFNNSFFELLQYRIGHDDGTGSGRTDIWALKIHSFISEGNILQLLFGMGFENAFKLGISTNSVYSGIGFHNDYIAILCMYGILGLITFIFILMYPLIICSRDKRCNIAAFLSVLFLTSCTLEPLSSGRLPFWGFYYMILVLSFTNKKLS